MKHSSFNFLHSIFPGICLEKCLEQNTSTPDETSTGQQNKETEDLIIRCFEKSGDISLYQLQERQEKGGTKVGGVAVQGGTGVWSVVDGDAYNLSPIVEHAVQKFPLMYIRKGFDVALIFRPGPKFKTIWRLLI